MLSLFALSLHSNTLISLSRSLTLVKQCLWMFSVKPEISYELKIIGAKKLLAIGLVVRVGRGFVAASDYNFFLKCAAKEGCAK